MQRLSATKEKIFDVAVELFSKHGYKGVSVRSIAYGAGIKESSIYNHFKNKEDILNHIFEFFHEGMKSNRPDAGELAHEIEFMAPREIFRLIFIKYCKNRDDRINKIAVIILMEQYINQSAREFFKEFMLKEPVAYYASILKAMAEKGRLRGNVNLQVAAEELHYGFLGIIFDLAAAVREGADDMAVISKLSNHVDFVFDCLEKPLNKKG